MTKKEKLNTEKFAIAAAKNTITRHCTDVVLLNLKGKSPAADYFLIATGTSDRQIKSVADETCKLAKKNNIELYRKCGDTQAKWVLLDFVDLVVHLFDEEFREYYDLELLWGDAEKVNIEE